MVIGTAITVAAVMMTKNSVQISLNLSDAQIVRGSGYNRLAGLTEQVLILSKEHFQSDPAARAAVLERLTQVAIQRKAIMLQTLNTDPAAVARVAIPDFAKTKIPKTVLTMMEQGISLGGVFSQTVDQTRARVYSLATTDGSVYQLYFATEPSKLKTGDQIKVTGYALDDKILVNPSAEFASADAVPVSSTACTRANPTVSIAPLSQWGMPGQTLKYTVLLKSNDTTACGTSIFNVVPSVSPDLIQVPKSNNVSVMAGMTATFNISITASKTATEGLYQFTETATNIGASGYSAWSAGNFNIGILP